MLNEWYVECFLQTSGKDLKLGELAFGRGESDEVAFANSLSRLYRESDTSRVSVGLRRVTRHDLPNVSRIMDHLQNAQLRDALGRAAAHVASGTQYAAFNLEDCAPEDWVRTLEGTQFGEAASWRDASWGNNAAPSWDLAAGDLIVAEVFYFAAKNAERASGRFNDQPFVVFCVFDDSDQPGEAFECSPDVFLSLVKQATTLGSTPAESLRSVAKQATSAAGLVWVHGSKAVGANGASTDN